MPPNQGHKATGQAATTWWSLGLDTGRTDSTTPADSRVAGGRQQARAGRALGQAPHRAARASGLQGSAPGLLEAIPTHATSFGDVQVVVLRCVCAGTRPHMHAHRDTAWAFNGPRRPPPPGGRHGYKHPSRADCSWGQGASVPAGTAIP